MKKHSIILDLFKDPIFAMVSIPFTNVVMAISKYSLELLPRGGLLFGYAGTGEEAILSGVKKLAAVLEQL